MYNNDDVDDHAHAHADAAETGWSSSGAPLALHFLSPFPWSPYPS